MQKYIFLLWSLNENGCGKVSGGQKNNNINEIFLVKKDKNKKMNPQDPNFVVPVIFYPRVRTELW